MHSAPLRRTDRVRGSWPYLAFRLVEAVAQATPGADPDTSTAVALADAVPAAKPADNSVCGSPPDSGSGPADTHTGTAAP